MHDYGNIYKINRLATFAFQNECYKITLCDDESTGPGSLQKTSYTLQ